MVRSKCNQNDLINYLRVPSTEASTEIIPIACPSSVCFNSPELPSLHNHERNALIMLNNPITSVLLLFTST